MKIDYMGFKIRRTGIPKVWQMWRPDGSWVLLRPSEEWSFEDEEEDLRAYVEMQVDLEEIYCDEPAE